MKLRNKKTGEVVEAFKGGPIDLYFYHSLAELNSDWEDYVPAEPIINETNHIPHNSNEIEVCLIDSQKGTITQFYSDGLYIQFWGRVAPDAISGRCYTIDELCGEEE